MPKYIVVWDFQCQHCRWVWECPILYYTILLYEYIYDRRDCHCRDRRWQIKHALPMHISVCICIYNSLGLSMSRLSMAVRHTPLYTKLWTYIVQPVRNWWLILLYWDQSLLHRHAIHCLLNSHWLKIMCHMNTLFISQ